MGRKKNLKQRDNIVITAYRMFYHRGYDNVTVKEIASECGITPSLLQHYFNKKEDIVIEIFYDLVMKVFTFIEDEIPDEQDIQMLTAMFYRLFYEALTADNNKLLHIYYVILVNADLLSHATDYALSHSAHSMGSTLNENLSVYLLNGMLSQLFTLHLNRRLQFGVSEVVNIALYAYFSFLRFKPVETEKAIVYIDSLMTKERIDTFIKDYIADTF